MVSHIGEQTSPRQRLRLEWAAKLRSQLDFLGWTQKRFRYELAEAGCNVSRQAVEQWLSGDTSPMPHHQAAIARVLRTAPHLLFPVEAA